MTLIIVAAIGLMLGFVSPSQISRFIGEQSGLYGVLLVCGHNAVLHIASLVSFPRSASRLASGASQAAVVAFIPTLTMIGTVTIPLEIRYLEKNGLATKRPQFRRGDTDPSHNGGAVVIGPGTGTEKKKKKKKEEEKDEKKKW